MIANFGCRRLMFRFPEKSVDFKAMKAYSWNNNDDYEHSLTIYKKEVIALFSLLGALKNDFYRFFTKKYPAPTFFIPAPPTFVRNTAGNYHG
jgi:hypothetical protein